MVLLSTLACEHQSKYMYIPVQLEGDHVSGRVWGRIRALPVGFLHGLAAREWGARLGSSEQRGARCGAVVSVRARASCDMRGVY